MSRRRLIALITIVAAILAISGIAVAALLVGSAEIEVTASVAEVDLNFRTGETLPGSPNNSAITMQCFDDPVNPGGPPCADAVQSLSAGVLTLSFDNVWSGRDLYVGDVVPNEDLVWLVNTGDFPVAVVDVDFAGAGFGKPGSGEPIEVELVEPAGPWTPLVYPFTLAAQDGVPVQVHMTVNEASATAGATYGPVTILILGQ